MLVLCQLLFGDNWKKISSFIESRTAKEAKRYHMRMKGSKKANLTMKIWAIVESQETIRPNSRTNLLMSLLQKQIREDRRKSDAQTIENCKKALIDFYLLEE